MTRARSLSRLANSTVFTVSDTNRVGIGSTIPDVKLDVGGKAIIDDTTQSTTTTSGALVVSGGVGIAKSLFVGGDMSVAGTLTYEDVTNVETAGITTTGGLVVTGLGATFGSGVGIADSIYHLDDSNTAIRFPAADTFSVETAGEERLRVDSSGRLLIGTDSTIFDNNFGIGDLQVTDKDGYQHVLFSGHSASASNATALSLGRSRGSQSSPGYLSSGDHIARFSATSYNGGNYQSSGCIDFFAADQHASDDLPGYIVFNTVPDGSATLTERLRITSAGLVGVGTVGPTHSLHVYDATDNSAQRNDVQAYTGGITIQNQSEVFDAFAALRFNFHGDDSFYLKTRRIANNNGEFEIGQNYSSTSTDSIAIKIDNNLNVGIGTTIPGTELHVQGNNGYAELRLSGNSGSGGTIEFYEATTKVADIFADTSNNIVFRNTTEALRIDVGGNVNIAGITTATQLFEGSTRVASTGKAIAMAMLFG